MKNRHLALCLVLALGSLLPACASTETVNPEIRRKAAKIDVLSEEEIGDREYEILGEVEGLSCARQAGSDPSRKGAERDMIVQAEKLNADAVISVFCEEGGTSLSSNCWSTFECRGDAIRWTE